MANNHIEVKPSRIANRKNFQNRFCCQREAAKALGKDLLLWTEEFIRRQPCFDNLQILHKYRTQDPITAEHRHILATACSYADHGVTIQDLAHFSDMNEHYFFPLVYDLITRNQLAVDLNTAPLTKHSLVGINHGHYPEIH